MEQYTQKPFSKAVGDILREKNGADAFGNVRLAPLIAQVEELTSLKRDYVRMMLHDERTLRMDVVEAAARVLGVHPSYFVEWRFEFNRRMETRYPDLIDENYRRALAYQDEMIMAEAEGRSKSNANHE